jgi:hypothetical protein
MKTILLTIDYELFLGEKTGDVRSCMIDPTKELASILAYNNSYITIFWDILHYKKLIEYQDDFPELMEDKILIEKQILELVTIGHDIQLHLHPHWLDAVYENGKWNFDYKRFKLQSLSEADNQNDINTIIGCINISKNLMENLIKTVNPEYKVTTFRAGGYLIQPFYYLREAFLAQNILIDSSICPGLINENDIFSYNFSKYPNLNFYKFLNEPKKINEKGRFIEVPIKTINIPIHLNLYYTFLRHTKYKNLQKGIKGSGSASTTKYKKPLYKKFLELFFKKKVYQFTIDSNFKEVIHYMINKVDENSTMILHPKLLNDHTMSLINALTQTNKVKFISIKNYLESEFN